MYSNPPNSTLISFCKNVFTFILLERWKRKERVGRKNEREGEGQGGKEIEKQRDRQWSFPAVGSLPTCSQDPVPGHFKARDPKFDAVSHMGGSDPESGAILGLRGSVLARSLVSSREARTKQLSSNILTTVSKIHLLAAYFLGRLGESTDAGPSLMQVYYGFV